MQIVCFKFELMIGIKLIFLANKMLGIIYSNETKNYAFQGIINCQISYVT